MQKLASLMRCARKEAGLTQVQMAQHLGITQGTYSKIEKGRLVLSTPEWYHFCKTTNIDPNSFLLGHIDRGQDVELGDRLEVGLFSISKQYGRNAGISVRQLRPLLQFGASILGGEELNVILKKEFDIDPDFFTDLGNRLNLNFKLDFLRLLQARCGLGRSTIGHLGSFLHNSFSSGETNLLDAVEGFIKETKKYQANFTYTVNKRSPNSLEVGVVANTHIPAFERPENAPVMELYSDYIREVLRNLAPNSTSTVEVSQQDNFHRFSFRIDTEVETADALAS